MNATSADTAGWERVAPPAIKINTGRRVGSAAVTCAFNGVQHRAVIDAGEGNWVRPGDIADALVALAGKVRAGA